MGPGAGRARRHALEQFIGDHAVALHDVARHVLVAVVRSIGNDLPAVDLGEAPGLAHRIVVVAGHPHDARAERGDRGLALGTDVGMQHDHAAAADALRRRGKRPAMVAVGRADHGELAQALRMAAGEQVFGGEHRLGPLALDQPQQRDRRAQHLEAAQRRTSRLILQVELAEAQAPRQAGQATQRRRSGVELGPVGEPAPALARALDVECALQRRGVGAAFGLGVDEQHEQAFAWRKRHGAGAWRTHAPKYRRSGAAP